jgi:hypothetical protein
MLCVLVSVRLSCAADLFTLAVHARGTQKTQTRGQFSANEDDNDDDDDDDEDDVRLAVSLQAQQSLDGAGFIQGLPVWALAGGAALIFVGAKQVCTVHYLGRY